MCSSESQKLLCSCLMVVFFARLLMQCPDVNFVISPRRQSIRTCTVWRDILPARMFLQDQWQSDMDKLYTEYENCKSDKLDFEDMVERLSKEMEYRIEGLKQEHSETLKAKDDQIRSLYIKVSRKWQQPK